MKRKVISILILALLALGCYLMGYFRARDHFRDATKMSQNDTIVRFDTIRYSRLELTKSTCKLDIPKIGRKELVYIPSDSATIIYRDSVRYVTLPRQYYFTETEGAQIWHSGIDSTIDSLNVVRKTQEITNTAQTVTKRNALAIGLDMNYSSRPDIPIYLEYSYLLHRNVEMSARLQYDLPSQEIGFGLGAKISIGW